MRIILLNLFLALLVLTISCEKNVIIEPYQDYESKLRSEFNMKVVSDKHILDSLSNLNLQEFSSYEDIYKHYKGMLSRHIERDTIQIYPVKKTKLLKPKMGDKRMDQWSASAQYNAFIQSSASSTLSATFNIMYTAETTIYWNWSQSSITAPIIFLGNTFSGTSSSNHFLGYTGTNQMTGSAIHPFDTANGGNGGFAGMANCYATIAGIPMSLSVKLNGTYKFLAPASPQSPAHVAHTFTATDATSIFPD